MKITFIHPVVGRLPGQKYLRAWQMECLPVAQLAALTPPNWQIAFYDDRMEEIDYNDPTDLVAISVETYTAKRAYQIANVYRKKGIHVVMGGFHATLCPDEVQLYADTVVTGEVENIWTQILQDFQNKTIKSRYLGSTPMPAKRILPDRSVFKGKNYVPVNLLEAGRGCKFRCEFCSIQEFFEGTHHYHSIESVIQEVNSLKSNNRLFFFVDDNITANHERAAELFKALIPLKIKWVGQSDITISHNPELLKLMVKSGCQGVLIGFESLNPESLKRMNKAFNAAHGGIDAAVQNINKHGLRIYATFLYGYDGETTEDFKRVEDFCRKNKLFMAGFNHLTPFPATPLYQKLEQQGRLLFKKWWLDDGYIYGQIPFKTILNQAEVEKACHGARKRFYSFSSIFYRMTNFTNINNPKMFAMYWVINGMLRSDASQRLKLPLGEQGVELPIYSEKQVNMHQVSE